MVIENNQLLAVATDSHRLSQRIIHLEMTEEQAGKNIMSLFRVKGL